MRFSLLDLIIATLSLLLGAIVVILVAHLAGHDHLSESVLLLGGIPVGLAFYLTVTPLIYQRFHLRPLLFPKCPQCQNKSRSYWFAKGEFNWPRDVIVCPRCQTSIELWYAPPKSENVSLTMPSFQLQWPQSWGRWRYLVRKENAGT
jgi:hypothetical protein